MNLFALTSLIMGVVSLALALFIFYHSKTTLHKFWAYFNLSLGVYGIALFFAGTSKTYPQAFFYWKIALFGVANISTFFYLFISELTKSKNKYIYTFVVVHGIIFGFLALTTDWVVNSLKFIFDEFYFTNAGLAWNILFSIWIIVVIYSFFELHKFIRTQKGLRKTQANYLFYSMLLGFTSGASTGVVAWATIIYPAWHFFICVYAALSTYAILRYNIMNIKVAFSRLGIFVVVYSIVLGIPFGGLVWGKSWLVQVLGENWYWAPMLSLLALATAGPSLYLYFQQRAEKHILQEEHRTQELLLQASYGMTTVHHLFQLSRLIVDMLSKILKIQKVQLFMLNQAINKYELKSLAAEKDLVTIDGESAIITELMRRKYPVTYDEIKFKAEGNHNEHFKNVLDQMKEFSCRAVVPIVFESNLLGFIALSDHKNKEIYSNELLNVLAVFGNQAALAMKNCYFLEDEARRMEEEGARDRMVSLDHMASSMAHEIDNPNTIILNQADLIVEALHRDPRTIIPEEVEKEVVGGLQYIKESSTRVSDMIRAILEYSRMGTGQLKPIKLYDALDSFEKLISPELKKIKVDIKKEIQSDLPYILGDKVQIEEIFMNLTTNALHAVKYKEGEKLIQIKVFLKSDKFIRIEFSDNGYGISKEMLSDVFLASVTTKGSVEGTGLGLYRVRKIVDKHKGKIWAESEGKNKGAKFIVELPVHREEFTDIISEDNQKPERKKKAF
jgi:signal transduction histidine kinase